MRNLISVVELFPFETPPGDGPVPLVATSVVWSENSTIYIAKEPSLRMNQITPQVLDTLVGSVIPKEHIYPPWIDGVTAAPDPIPPEIYVKTCQRLHDYDETQSIADGVADEIKIMEVISKKPHPNVCHYHGCVREGDLIRGIGIRKYKCTLWEAISRKNDVEIPPFDHDSVLQGIQAGLDHIHSFGLVHNDINPSNIMLDEAGKAVIIDFDSCRALDTPAGGGTPGWTNFATVSQIENDRYGLDLISKFMRGEYDGRDY
ncbi:unnamed protein product [Cyclocybe aegerita]|uniref:Protein kinase domain-containing protein n=1 Tax=Cyclocybe aegerita TaxID=1973307 RepID=A0A8S0VQP8_CYCAE|nr:unnamed protein product [Cyclocybe aegerita]